MLAIAARLPVSRKDIYCDILKPKNWMIESPAEEPPLFKLKSFEILEDEDRKNTCSSAPLGALRS
jgi:hypothetical protein